MGSNEQNNIELALAKLVSINPYDRFEAIETLAHLRCVDAVERLVDLTHDPHWGVREAAAWALGDIAAPIPAAIERLTVLAHTLKDRIQMRYAALYGLGCMGDVQTLPLLFDIYCYSPDPLLSHAAGRALLRFDDHIIPMMQDILLDYRVQSIDTRLAAAQMLGKLRHPAAVDSLTYALDHDMLPVQWEAAQALGEIADAQAVAVLVRLLQDTPPELGRICAWALQQIDTPDALEAVAIWRDKYPDLSYPPDDDNPQIPPPRPNQFPPE